MAITKKDLQAEVDRLNKKYCDKSKHELVVSGAYGGYMVQLTGKKRKDGKGFRGMGSGVTDITRGYTSARKTMTDLIYADANGIVSDRVKRCDKLYPLNKKKTAATRGRK